MGVRMNNWLHHQQRRFMRPDRDRYLRSDAGRFVAPGRKWDDQPRIEAGSPEGGQFTFGTQGDSDTDNERVYIHTPRDSGDDGDGVGGGGGSDLDNFWLAAPMPPGIGHNSEGAQLEEPPEIPDEKPTRSSSTLLRAAANWIARALAARAFGAVSLFISVIGARSWARSKAHEIVTSLDPPKSLEDLEAAVNEPRRGTELHHHKMEQHVSKQRGLSQSEIDAPGNRVRIPTFKHYEITSWYRTPNRRFGGLSPRQYLADKPPEEHAKVGREALILFKVLRP